MKDRLLFWTLSFLHPYRKRVAILAALLLTEIGLGALQPWPLAIVIDYVLGGRPIPEPFAGWLTAIHGGDRFVLLVVVVVAGRPTIVDVAVLLRFLVSHVHIVAGNARGGETGGLERSDRGMSRWAGAERAGDVPGRLA